MLHAKLNGFLAIEISMQDIEICMVLLYIQELLPSHEAGRVVVAVCIVSTNWAVESENQTPSISRYQYLRHTVMVT